MRQEREKDRALKTDDTAVISFDLENVITCPKIDINEETSRLFRSFENNSAAFSDDALRNVRVAAELSAAQTRFSSNNNNNNNRGRGRRGRGYIDHSTINQLAESLLQGLID
ncbi:hypothetical protein ElyMa_000139000 [Elysia marginata]|uniref:Uncharacterized protein n=1 Tax=Elysia marginata TaxID=1093978 RepID=A0AAV4EQ40_9GAST|nr:hypothetical protein ElyMa_000139000 [Elysia marginata]